MLALSSYGEVPLEYLLSIFITLSVIPCFVTPSASLIVPFFNWECHPLYFLDSKESVAGHPMSYYYLKILDNLSFSIFENLRAVFSKPYMCVVLCPMFLSYTVPKC